MWKEFCREREPPTKKDPWPPVRKAQGSKEGFSSEFKDNQLRKLINNERR